MKVALVTHETFFPVKGGGAIRVSRIAESFIRKGHDVRIYAPFGHSYRGECEVFPGIGFRGICNIERFKTKNKEIAYIKFILKASVILLFEEYDFLFSHIAVAGASALPAKIIRKCPSLIDLDDIISGLSSLKVVNRVLPAVESYVPLFFNGVTCMSQALAEIVRKRRNDNVFVVPHGADLELFKPSENNSKPEKGHFVFSGGIEAHDGVDLILKAADLLKGKYPFIKVTIIGDGSKLEESIELRDKLGLHKYIEFTGWLERDKIPFHHQKCCAGLIADRQCDATEVALVVRGVEYMASGLPVVASDHSGNRELLNDGVNGFLFKSGDYESLVGKMEWIINNPSPAQEMGNKGRKYAEDKFSWAKNADRIVDICESIYSKYGVRS